MAVRIDNSDYRLHPRNKDLYDFTFSSALFPLDNSVTSGLRSSCKGSRHGRKNTLPQSALMHESEKDVVWFKKHFLGKRHLTLLCPTSPRGPLALSYIEDKQNRCFKLLIRYPEGSQRHVIAQSVVTPPSLWRRLFGLGHNPLSVIKKVFPELPTKHIYPCISPTIPNDLLNIDERQIIRKFKFGVGYIPPGGFSESDMLAVEPENMSKGFKTFLKWIGNEIELKGWKGYRGGLDVKNNSTGTKALYTLFHGNDIIYHVSPFLPSPTESSKNNYVERKRHLGNDMILILFQDRTNTREFRLETLGSRLNHIVCVVREAANGSDAYEITMAMKDGVPSFGPELPNISSVLRRDEVGREWFIYKLIQAERATYRAPVFASKIARTRTILLTDLIEKFEHA